MEKIIDMSVRRFSKPNEIIQALIIAIIAFLVPTFLGELLTAIFGKTSAISINSQLIIGSIVNTMLVISALNIRGWAKVLPILTMPSVSTIFSGYVFKSASVFLVYMIPAIWIGNFILVFAFKYFTFKLGKPYILSAIIGIIGKVAIIYGSFMLLKVCNVFPTPLVAKLQNAMSIIQLITATIGCTLGYCIYLCEKRKMQIPAESINTCEDKEIDI